MRCCVCSSSLWRNLTFALYRSLLLLAGHQLYFPTSASLPLLFMPKFSICREPTRSFLHPAASLSKQPRRCSRAWRCRFGKGAHTIVPTADQGCYETPVHASPSLLRLTGRTAFLCITKQGQKMKYKLNINNWQISSCAPKVDSQYVCLPALQPPADR